MKTKTIIKVLNQKLDDWAASITDPEVRKLVENNTIITGGCIVSMLRQEEVNDYDVYFRDRKTTLAVAQYYADRFGGKVNIRENVDASGREAPGRISIRVEPKSTGINDDEDDKDAGVSTEDSESKEKYRPVFFTSNAITLSDKIQIIVRFYGEPEEIHANYDYVHCTSYWTSWESKQLTTPVEALKAILAKELVYVGSKYPLCSIIRMRKFIQRGWSINAGQILKMCLNLQDFDLNDPHVLQEQLIGVDSAYFCQLLAAIQKAGHERIDYAYITAIIDRIF